MEPTSDSSVKNEVKTVLVRILSPGEATEFIRKGGIIKRYRPPGSTIRCPFIDCRKAHNYAIKNKGWLQQEGEDIGSNTATKVIAYHCRKCDRDFNDLTPIGPSSDAPMNKMVLPPPGPERMAFLEKLFPPRPSDLKKENKT